MKHELPFLVGERLFEANPFPFGKGFARCEECVAFEDECLCATLPTCGGKKPVYFVEHEDTFEDLLRCIQ
jgi:DTW domain-containing protein YfiP